ncbi:integrator complex subunit 3-like [Saccoglossus kowalevskii]|uniref:Integrator complex subunit 3-like n=1 Tax=Saccoglossus kowalevskii TaxID=10224 RepID=A0ABM0MQM7_SACKO|nr:PREDICTED: integrator complex subunit 3-like [Saccoglossus kowalevskii]
MDEKPPKSRLFSANTLDPKDEIEERMERGYATLLDLTRGLSERETHDALNAHVCKGMPQHEDITLGLLYSILIDPPSAPKNYRDLALITRDGMGLTILKINEIVLGKFLRVSEKSRNQLIWVVRELVKNSVVGTDGICSSLLRQISGGDVTPKNIWLAESMLDVLSGNRAWLDKQPSFIPIAVYTYLRLIEDHSSQLLSNLRQREVDFCVSLMREKFMDCSTIGRDLVRLLQSVARIPEVQKLWKDILHNPQILSPQFTGLVQLLNQRTSRKFLVCRLTPDMENKMVFLTSKVKFGQQKRYQEWFQRLYLSTPESQSLRCDLIRFICGVIHPSNEVLCSDIIPRWAVIGWLLTTCTSNVAASSAKLALFYDWLFYQPRLDNIMNIEPAILVMHHSMRSHLAITATLLDFLCRIMPNFYPPLESQVRQGVKTALKSILDKRVLPSLLPLLDNAKLDKELRSMIRENFSEFCSAEAIKDSEQISTTTPPPQSPTTPPPSNTLPPTIQPLINKDIDFSDSDIPNKFDEATFSDDEDDDKGKLKVQEYFFRPIRDLEEVDIDQCVDQLSDELKDVVRKLSEEKELVDTESQCETMETLCGAILEMDEFDSEQAAPLASLLLQLYKDHFNGELIPQELSEENLLESISKPVFVIFRNISQSPEEDACPIQLLTLVCHMYEKHPQIGYHLLYFLIVSSKVEESKLYVYEEVCKNSESGDLEVCLKRDFQTCQEDDIQLLCYLITPVYNQFSDATLGNTDLLHIIVSCIDASQLQDLICEIMQGNLVMFKEEDLVKTIEITLEWETFEQYCVWQLLIAHDDVPVDQLTDLTPKLTYKDHPEALTSILLMLKNETANFDLLRPILNRPVVDCDKFTISILSHWALQDDKVFSELVKTVCGKVCTAAKRQKPRPTKFPLPSVNQVLGHLDALKLTPVTKQCTFFNQEAFLIGLTLLQGVCDDSQKMKYGDLFALTEELSESFRTTRSKRKTTGSYTPRSTTTSTSGRNKPIESSSSESEDEDVVPPRLKKRRKPTGNGSDSD